MSIRAWGGVDSGPILEVPKGPEKGHSGTPIGHWGPRMDRLGSDWTSGGVRFGFQDPPGSEIGLSRILQPPILEGPRIPGSEDLAI